VSQAGGAGDLVARVRPEAGAEVTWHESEIPHTIDPRFLGELPAWVDAVVHVSPA